MKYGKEEEENGRRIHVRQTCSLGIQHYSDYVHILCPKNEQTNNQMKRQKNTYDGYEDTLNKIKYNETEKSNINSPYGPGQWKFLISYNKRGVLTYFYRKNSILLN